MIFAERVHSGAPRSGEPGIHNPDLARLESVRACFLFQTTKRPAIGQAWCNADAVVMNTGLRPAASPGMTEYQQNDIEDDMH